MRLVLLPLSFLSACCDCASDTSEPPDPCPGWVQRYIDRDGDGLGYEYTERCSEGGIADHSDCDDENPDVGAAGPLYDDVDVDGYGAGFPVGEGCPDWHYSASDADCNDTNPDVYPGAPELCDAIDTDCDAATGEDGLATFWSEDGPIDETAALTGTAAAPVELSLDEPGTLEVCAGTWYARLVLNDDVAVHGPSGAELTTLDAANSGTVVTIDGARSRSVAVRGFTLTGGSAAYGGALYCSGDHQLSLEDNEFIANTADSGGAFASDGCTVYQFRGSFTGNTAAVGGGAWVADGYVEFNDTTFEGNEASVEGGALAMDVGASGAFVGVHTVLITANHAPSGGAISLAGEAELQIFGDDGTGVLANTSDSGGVVTTDARSLVEFVTTDLGITGSERDNSPIDVTTIIGDYAIDDGVTGWCYAEGCTFL